MASSTEGFPAPALPIDVESQPDTPAPGPGAVASGVGAIQHLPIDQLPVVILKPRRAQPLLAGHPWLFEGSLQRVVGAPVPGSEVAVVTDRDEFVAYGLYNPLSRITVRLYSWDAAQRLTDEFWTARLQSAIDLRERVLQWCQPDSACRLVFSEADDLSGLIVDRYGEWLLVQWTSLALAARGEVIIRALQERLRPKGIWLRTEKGIREAEGLSIADGLLAGEPPPRPMFVNEHGLRFGVDVVEGQKTGFFLDQRENRRHCAAYFGPGRLLDLCTYSGAFALHALRQGQVSEVLAVDVSESALRLARANAELNGLSSRLHCEKGDMFRTLERFRDSGERFASVVLDPPKLARNARGVDEALRGYHSLNRMALEVLEPGGILVTCSCSGQVSREDFEQVLAQASVSARRKLQILESRGAAADHPVSALCPETRYLKCAVCRVD